MEKINFILKVVIILGIIVISFFLGYYYFYRPYTESKIYKKCFSRILEQNMNEDNVLSFGDTDPEKIKFLIEVCTNDF